MKLWIGGEISSDVANAFRSARKDVESSINFAIANISYPIEIDSWDCIAIIRDDEAFEEQTALLKQKRDMDFRLKIDHSKFLATNDRERRSLIFQMLLRSLNILIEKGVSEEGVNRLIQDLQLVARRNAW